MFEWKYKNNRLKKMKIQLTSEKIIHFKLEHQALPSIRHNGGLVQYFQPEAGF